VTHYLMREPIEQTLDEFFALAQRLREQGRFPYQTPPLFQGAPRLLETYAAPRTLVLPEVIPFRPNRGIYLIIEEPADDEGWDAYLRARHTTTMPELMSLPGVAGAWVFGTTSALKPRPIFTPGRHLMTLCYLDDDPAEVGRRLLAPLRQLSESNSATRPLLAAPFESIVKWDWDRF
jgi:hypothetical protein